MSGGQGALERRLGRVLDIGSMLSTALLAVSIAVALVPAMAAGSDRIANAGLVILLATPVLRVAMAAAGFLLAREWRNGVLAAIVLAVLLGSVATATLQ